RGSRKPSGPQYSNPQRPNKERNTEHMTFKRVNDIIPQGETRFFKPKEFADTYALLIEPSEARAQVKTTDYYVQEIEPDQPAGALEAGQPDVEGDYILTHKALVNIAREAIGEAVPAVLASKQMKSRPGTYWAFEGVDVKTESLLATYYEKRESGDTEELPF